MHNRRFTRLTNAFSKKFDGHVQMVAIWTVWYNWIRIHKNLRVTPAMASGLTDRLWSFEEIVAGMDAIAPKAGRPKTYKKAQIAWKLQLWNYSRVANFFPLEVSPCSRLLMSSDTRQLP